MANIVPFTSCVILLNFSFSNKMDNHLIMSVTRMPCRCMFFTFHIQLKHPFSHTYCSELKFFKALLRDQFPSTSLCLKSLPCFTSLESVSKVLFIITFLLFSVSHIDFVDMILPILCLTSRTTVTSARIPDEDARATCVLSHAFKKEHRDERIKDSSCSVFPLARSVTSRSFSG